MEKKPSYLPLILLIVWVCFCLLACDSPTSPEQKVTVILNLPQSAPGRPWHIGFDDDLDGDYIWFEMGTCGQEANITLEFDDVPAGTYYLTATVFVVSDGTAPPIPGDYTGIYLRRGQERRELFAPNATVPESGSVTFEVNLSV